MTERCNNCGLPMSLVDDPTVSDEPYWYCDGPNDETTEMGCSSMQAIEQAQERIV